MNTEQLKQAARPDIAQAIHDAAVSERLCYIAETARLAECSASQVKRIWAETKHGNTRYHIERVGKKAAGRMLDGRAWDEVPA